ncbi:hypothetical protein AUJ14_02675 [Candidatus Micrarchaeota archaeon CG1_02_55_22]|nr:MAG: hypothetical protein AUJ14_02675 [Candidatus Micrarchaeota archaeon CG1_02_55_22]
MNLERLKLIWRYNSREFSAYFILALVLPIIILALDLFTTQSWTASTVLFSVFAGLGLNRFFQECRKIDRKLDALRDVLQQVRVWTKPMKTLVKRKWMPQLNWLDGQLKMELVDFFGLKVSPPRYLIPHPFSKIQAVSIKNLANITAPDKQAQLIGSIQSVNHKIDHLNFILAKLHGREAISSEELDEIRRLVSGSNRAVLQTLRTELKTVEKEITTILKKYDAMNAP